MSRTFKNQPKVERIKKVKSDNDKRNLFKRSNFYDFTDDEDINL